MKKLKLPGFKLSPSQAIAFCIFAGFGLTLFYLIVDRVRLLPLEIPGALIMTCFAGIMISKRLREYNESAWPFALVYLVGGGLAIGLITVLH